MNYSEFSILGKTMIPAILVLLALLGHMIRARLLREKPTKEMEKTVIATVVSKEIKNGTNRSGRSKGGFSYVVNFLTEDGQILELYAYEIEFGGLKDGMRGLLTYKDRYFVCFDESI